jgi:hypothetical protein
MATAPRLNAQPRTRNAKYLTIGVPFLPVQKCADRVDMGVTGVTKHCFYLAPDIGITPKADISEAHGRPILSACAGVPLTS